MRSYHQTFVFLYAILEFHNVLCQIDFNAGDVLSNCQPELSYTPCMYNINDTFRTYDGTCNNKCAFATGAANSRLVRLMEANYADNLHVPYGFPFTNASSANLISRAVFDVHEKNSQATKHGMSVLFMSFGQFLDHDISITPIQKCTDIMDCSDTTTAYQYPCFPVKFNNDDSNCTILGRSVPLCRNSDSVREFPNMVTSFIDGSGLYSSSEENSKALRAFENGSMLLDENDLLPLLPEEDCTLLNGCSLGGEIRLDENIALNAIHTVMIREHNRIAKELADLNPTWDDEKLFENTRKIMGAILQHIVYEEYIPHLAVLPKYTGYSDKTTPSISVEFSTAAFRFGHSLVPNSWAILDNNFDKNDENLSLRETLNNISYIRTNGIENILYGLLANQSQDLDTNFAHGVARTLEIPPMMSGYRDLTALNIQRGRDHGLQTYGSWRETCNIGSITSWEDLIDEIPQETIDKLRTVYEEPKDIELYPAGVSENPIDGFQLGPLFSCIVKDQFLRIRDGDRFFYKNEGVFTENQRAEIEKVSLAKIFCNNLKDIVSIQENVFVAYNTETVPRRVCEAIQDMNFEAWKES